MLEPLAHDEGGGPSNPQSSDKRSRKRSRSQSKEKRTKNKNRKGQQKEDSFQSSSEKKEKKLKLPLTGLVLSVSTFSEKKEKVDVSFNAVSNDCKVLGATVTSQISKRVQLVVCTLSAVKQATQRVRKAFKKGIPIVTIDWLEACKKEGKMVPIDDFLLDEEAKTAVSKRATSRDNEKTEEFSAEELPAEDAGWSEPKQLGCCCVCHENGSEKDCPWCIDCT